LRPTSAPHRVPHYCVLLRAAPCAQMGSCTRALLLDASDACLAGRLVAGGETTDPPPEAAQRRVRTYRNQTLPAIQALGERGVLSKVDASGSADQTFAALAAAFATLGV